MIIGIDPNSTTVGYAVGLTSRIPVAHDTEHEDCPSSRGRLTANSSASMIERVESLSNQFRSLLDHLREHHSSLDFTTIIEIPDMNWQAMPTRPATTEALFAIGYSLVLVARSYGIPTYTIDPRIVKKLLTGKGNASKTEVQQVLSDLGFVLPTYEKSRYKKLVRVIDEDATDALAISYIVMRYGIDVETLRLRS